jgi:molybdenum cofactor cytidylyltransferase
LITQIETGPRSRDPISVAIILLAAGKASRMGVGGPHKLLAEFAGVPLVRRSAARAVSSGADSVTVVTGWPTARLG